jgi:hypothetical protein
VNGGLCFPTFSPLVWVEFFFPPPTTHFWSWWTMFNFSFQSLSLLELINIFSPSVSLFCDKDKWTFPRNPPFKALHKACEFMHMI